MSQDATQILVGANGDAYAGPTTTPAPTNSTTSLDAGFLNLGLLTEEGATLTVGRTLQDILAWQSFSPVRKIVTERLTEVSFTLLQVNKDNIEFAFGGGDVTGGTGVKEVQAANLVGFSGTDNFKITYGGNESALITRGGNYTAAGIRAAIEAITAFGTTVTVQDVTDTGFLVTFNAVGVRTAFTITSVSGLTGTFGQLVAGAAAGSPPYTYTPDADADAPTESSFVVEAVDGSRHYRIYVPKGLVTSDATLPLMRTDAAKIPVTFTAIPDAGNPPFYMWSDDAAMA